MAETQEKTWDVLGYAYEEPPGRVYRVGLTRDQIKSCAKIRTFAPTTCCRHWVTRSTRPGCAIIAAPTCSASNGAPENFLFGYYLALSNTRIPKREDVERDRR